MGFVIAVSQSKGGSSKTTTAVNLCGALIEKGYKAVVADMDKDKPDAINWARQGLGLDFVIELFEEKPKTAGRDLRMKVYFDETQKERGKINTNYSILRDSLKGEGFQVDIYNDFPIEEKGLRCDVLVFA